MKPWNAPDVPTQDERRQAIGAVSFDTAALRAAVSSSLTRTPVCLYDPLYDLDKARRGHARAQVDGERCR